MNRFIFNNTTGISMIEVIESTIGSIANMDSSEQISISYWDGYSVNDYTITDAELELEEMIEYLCEYEEYELCDRIVTIKMK